MFTVIFPPMNSSLGKPRDSRKKFLNDVFRILGLVHYQNYPCDRLTYPHPIISWIWPEYLAPLITCICYYFLATQIAIIREKEELSEVDALVSKAGGAVAALVMKANDGSRIALGYQIKDVVSTFMVTVLHWYNVSGSSKGIPCLP